MADTVRVDPSLLRRAGVVLAEHGAALLAVQGRCGDDADAARPGWVGASAGALAGLLEGWAVGDAHRAGRLSAHADGLHAVAAELLDVDRAGARTCCR